MNHSSVRYYWELTWDRVQEGHGATRKGWQGKGCEACKLVNQIIEEAQEGICTFGHSPNPLAFPSRPLQETLAASTAYSNLGGCRYEAALHQTESSWDDAVCWDSALPLRSFAHEARWWWRSKECKKSVSIKCSIRLRSSVTSSIWGSRTWTCVP